MHQALQQLRDNIRIQQAVNDFTRLLPSAGVRYPGDKAVVVTGAEGPW